MAIDLYVPLKKYSTRVFPVWYSDETKKIIINKKLAHKRYKISNSVADYERFFRLRALSRSLIRNDHRSYLQTTEQSLF